jgi:stringent starvation protein B
VKDGEIVLNVHPEATHMLTMDNEWILFNARFNGMSQEIAVPFSAVIGIFSKETGYGMGFQPAPEPVLAPLTAVATAPETSAPSGASTALDGAPSDKSTTPAAAPAKSKVSHLKVVK